LLDLGEGLHAIDTTASYMLACTLELTAGVRVDHDGTVLIEAPGGDGLAALTQQMSCLAWRE